MTTIEDVRKAMREYGEALMQAPPGHDDRFRGAALLALLDDRDRLAEALLDVIARANLFLEDPEDLGDMGKLQIAIERAADLLDPESEGSS